MRRLLRRIAAVEGALSARHQLDPKIAGSALFSLSLDEMDLLLQASVAVLEGRALTEPQRAARQAYRLALERKCMTTFLALAGTPASPSGHGRVFTKSPEVAGEQQGKVISATLCHHIKARRNVCGDFSRE
jgi:hypothetical protein